MDTIKEVKDFLDKLYQQKKSPVVAKTFYLGIPGIKEAECQDIEKKLNIQIPETYRSFLLAYDWSTLRLGNLKFFSNAQTIIDNNQMSTNPFYEFYRANNLLEIGNYEANPICIRLKNKIGSEGEIVCLDHNSYPKPEVMFVSSNFERLVVCAAINLRLKTEAGDSQSENIEELYNQIISAILRVEPRANESPFWYNLIRGF